MQNPFFGKAPEAKRRSQGFLETGKAGGHTEKEGEEVVAEEEVGPAE